jgi:hypothetical protein
MNSFNNLIKTQLFLVFTNGCKTVETSANRRKVLNQMRNILVILLVFIYLPTLGQGINYSNFQMKLKIVEEEVTYNSKKQDAIELNLVLEKQNELFTPVYLYHFYKYVPGLNFFHISQELDFICESPIGLAFVIEDSIGKRTSNKSSYDLVSYATIEGAVYHSNCRFFVDSKKLKIKEKNLNYQKLHNYDLSKGEYTLYFIYSFDNVIINEPFSGIRNIEKPDSKYIFRGCLLSDSIKLIVTK